MARVKGGSTFRQTFRAGYEARQQKRTDRYAYRPYLRDMPSSSSSSDGLSSGGESGLSEVEGLLDAVGGGLSHTSSPTRDLETSDAHNLSFSESQYLSKSTATKEYETSRFSSPSLGGSGQVPATGRPGGALRKSHFIDH